MNHRAPHLLRAFLVTALLWLALPLLAQSEPDLTAWEALAGRAETTLEAGNASDLRLEDLRSEIVGYREGFQKAQGVNKSRITTLEAQISALGDPPGEEDPPEAVEIASRRAELERQLAQLKAPQRSAEEAYNRADGLIREIDNTIRERQTEEALSRGQSPLNPALWATAFGDVANSFHAWHDEISEALDAENRPESPGGNSVIIAVLLVIALVLLLRGRTAVEWLTLRFYAGWHGHSSPALAFIISLGQIAAPVLGLTALSAAGFMSGLLGLRGQLLAENLPTLGILAFGAIWLGARLFPRRVEIDAPLPIPIEQRHRARVYVTLLGLVLCGGALLGQVVEFDRYSTGTRAVLSLLLMLFAGLVLVRLGRLLTAVRLELASQDEAETATVPYFTGIVHLIGRIATMVGVIGPLLVAIGFEIAGTRLVYAVIGSLALLGLLAVLRLAVRDFYAMFMQLDPRQAGEALTPVLISFLLGICALPLFALIWGVRSADLFELWTRFREGFSFGETHISPTDFVSFAMVFALGFAMTRLLQGTLRSSVLPKTQIDTGGRNAIVAGTGYVGIFFAAIFAIISAGIDLSSLAIVAGALSVGIGFGLQNIVSNFVSGIILLIERPISEGDWIEVGGQMGYVRDISVRSTRIETFDRTDVIVPNADFVSGTVTNWTRGNLVGRVIVPVGVGYGSDTRQVETILQEIAEAHPLVVMKPPPAVVFMEFGASSLNFEIRAILRDVNFVLSVKSDMNHAIAARFREEGIEIPFAQRDIWLRNPEALHGVPRGASAAETPPAQAAQSDRAYLTLDDVTDTGDTDASPPSEAGKDDI